MLIRNLWLGSSSIQWEHLVQATVHKYTIQKQGSFWLLRGSQNEASYKEHTYLLTIDLSGADDVPMSIGEVDGCINDQYSLDSYNGFY